MAKSREDAARVLGAYYDPLLKDAGACPFCEGTFLAIAEWATAPIIPRPTWRIYCITCSTLGPIGLSREQAVQHWNRNFQRLTLKGLKRAPE